MHFLIVTPAPPGSTKGNRITAERWAEILVQLGHQVTIVEDFQKSAGASCPYHLLVALHAVRSEPAARRFREMYPDCPTAVVLTGTDLHRDLEHSAAGQENLERADCLILLESEGVKLLAPHLRGKARVIYQSAVPLDDPAPRSTTDFEVTVIGHLRDVKDPFQTALAARRLPAESRIQVLHLGVALSDEMRQRAEREVAENPRYTWLGGVSHDEARRYLARSRLTVLSSKIEGAPSVISEAVVSGTPVLATRITASLGLLGADYPGLFEVGDTERLSELLFQAEQDASFYQQLVDACTKKAFEFTPERELESWKQLIQEFVS